MPPDEPPTFGELLKRYRMAAGLTQEELAEQAGRSARGISDLERGARRAPYAETVRRLAESLHLGEAEHRALLAVSRRSAQSVEGPSPEPRPAPPLPSQINSFIGREVE